MSTPGFQQRRRLLGAGVWSICALIGAGLAAALGSAVVFPVLNNRREEWVPVGNLDQFTPVPQQFAVRFVQRQGWYDTALQRIVFGFKKEASGEMVVLSSACTHLGCTVRWEPALLEFRCPCHGGVFDPEGKVMAGPPTHPLVRFPVRLQDELVWIRTS